LYACIIDSETKLLERTDSVKMTVPYSDRKTYDEYERGLRTELYNELLHEIKAMFPEYESIIEYWT
jgi:hypothetical protein